MKNSKKILPQLSRLSIFDGMPETGIEEILDEASCSLHSYEKNEVFLRQGDAYPALSIVLEGTCVSEMNDYSGRTVVLAKFTAPFSVAPGFLFLEKGSLPISLKAETPVTVMSISRDRVFAGLRKNGIFLRNFLRLLSTRIEYLTDRVSFHSCGTIREKLLTYLKSLQTENEASVTLPMSVEELARYFGVARPSLSQVFSDLQQEGLFEKKGREIVFPS